MKRRRARDKSYMVNTLTFARNDLEEDDDDLLD